MRRSLRPVAAAFVLFGSFWGSWAVAAADIESGLHLSNGGLGLLLSVAVGAGGVAAAAAGGLAERWGVSRLLTAVLGGWGAVLLAAAAVPGRWAFLTLFVLAMVAAGLVDMAMNGAATAALAGRPGSMVRLHALFNGGALVGATATGLVVHAGLSWRCSWAAVGLGALGLAARSCRPPVPDAGDGVGVGLGTAAAEGRPPVHGSERDAPRGRGERSTLLRSLAALRAAHLGVLAAVFAVTTVVEGGIDTWGVLYLRRHLAAGVLVGAGAYAVGQVIAVSTRGLGGPAIGRIGARWGLVVGAATASAGLFAEALAHHVVPAAAGLALAAGGISLCWPLVMAALADIGAPDAGDVAPTAPAAGHLAPAGGSATALVGAFTASGYLGWVAGPALIGWVSEHAGLGGGLALLGAMAAAAAVTLVVMPVRYSPR